MSSRTMTVGGTAYPVLLPNLRDSRLHVAAVIITIHVLGQVTLRFHVSVPQILSAIVTCALLEVLVTFWRRRAVVWPASAMLTGSGVALILRVPDTPLNDHWTFHAWYAFAGIAGFSLLTKYVIRHRGSHVFNPSNIGLVVAFLIFGSRRLEPLDFWWAPTSAGMIAAYVVITVGGLLITARLRLLTVAATFWLTLAAGVGVLAASGHCMTARWAFAPVCGFDFWRVIVTSPEVLIFMFFMITDPKTVPEGRVGRVVFGVITAVVSTVLMATQTQEFGTKVALLAGLVLVCLSRPILDRLVPEPQSGADTLRRYAARLAFGRPASGTAVRPMRIAWHSAAMVAAVLFVGAGIVVAGSPARGDVSPDAADVLGRLPHDVNPATFPDIRVEQDVIDWNHEIGGAVARQIVLTLVENLAVENEALLQRDAGLLEAVDHGDRLDEMRARIEAFTSSGDTATERYRIDNVDVTLLVPFGKQDGLSLGLVARGEVTVDSYVDGRVQSTSTSSFTKTFAVRRATGARWLNVGVLPAPSDG